MYRQLFAAPSDDSLKFGGKLISEIPEEEDESGSDEDSSSSDEEDILEEAKIESNHQTDNEGSHSLDQNDAEDEDGCEDEDVGDEGEIPEDFEVESNIRGYFLNAKDNQLADKKGHKY